MRRIAALGSAFLFAAGCGARTASTPAGPAGQPVAAAPAPAEVAPSQPAGTRADTVPRAEVAAPQAPAALPAMPRDVRDTEQWLRHLARGLRTSSGTTVDLFAMPEVPANARWAADPGLQAPPGGYNPLAMPETTQSKADVEAIKWAHDAKELAVGWGYRGRWQPLSAFGNSRHVYYSPGKKRLLYLDYSFFRFARARWESDELLLEFGGQLITVVLREPRGRYPYNGHQAFHQAVRYGYDFSARTQNTIKGIMIHPLFIGPNWAFYDEANRPALIVDATDGSVRWNGVLLDLLRLVDWARG